MIYRRLKCRRLFPLNNIKTSFTVEPQLELEVELEAF